MRIILPPHNKVASEVLSWEQIKNDAKLIREMVNGKFDGNFTKAYSLAHAQVSEEPKTFFVVSRDKKYGLEKILGHWCIINPKIIEASDRREIKEACMSFPLRDAKYVRRYFKVKVQYQVPGLFRLKKKTRTLVQVPAQIFQHEIEHSRGENIFHRKTAN